MKCPECGLVHSPGEHVCRRCEIDLKSLEPASRAVPRSIQMARNGRLGNLGASSVRSRKAASSDDEKKPSGENKGKETSGILSAFKGSTANKSVTAIECVQCRQKMELEKIMPFSKKWPMVFLALGVLLAIGGVFLNLLFITAVISVAAGLLYPRVGITNWICNSCGMHIPRA
jgi:hypothetical protein